MSVEGHTAAHKKVMSNSPGLVDCILNLPNRQVKFYREFNFRLEL